MFPAWDKNKKKLKTEEHIYQVMILCIKQQSFKFIDATVTS